jgi:hypothetical protein
MALVLSLNQSFDVSSFFSFEHVEHLLGFLIGFFTSRSVHLDIALQTIYEFSKVWVSSFSKPIVA